MIKKITVILISVFILLAFTIWIPDSKEMWVNLKFEICEITFSDGIIFYFTTFLEDRIIFSVQEFKKIIENVFKRKISDITVIKHNHPVGSDAIWSRADRLTYARFKFYGFKGDYVLLYGKDEICRMKGEKK